MGILTDYFVASPAQLDAIRGGAPDGKSRIDAKGFGTVPCEALGKALGVKALVPGEPAVHGDDFEWFIIPLTDAMVAALAAMTDAEVASHGAMLAKRPEVKASEGVAQAFVGELRALANRGVKAKKGMYLYTAV